MIIENELCVSKAVIGGCEVNSVDLRTVYKWLDLPKDHFARWCVKRLSDFANNFDYVHISSLAKIGESQKSTHKLASPNTVNYLVTLDTAKHICMLERNEKGFEARQYFIRCERKLQELVANQRLALANQKIAELTAELKQVEISKAKKSPYKVVDSNGNITDVDEETRLRFKISHLENMIVGCEVNIDKYKRELASFDTEEII